MGFTWQIYNNSINNCNHNLAKSHKLSYHFESSILLIEVHRLFSSFEVISKHSLKMHSSILILNSLKRSSSIWNHFSIKYGAMIAPIVWWLLLSILKIIYLKFKLWAMICGSRKKLIKSPKANSFEHLGVVELRQKLKERS